MSRVRQQTSRGVNLTKSVQLVAHHVEKQGIARLNLLNKLHRVGFVQLEHRDIGIQLARKRDLRKQRGDDATHKIRASRVRENLQSQAFQKADHHASRCGFAVSAADHHSSQRKIAQGASKEARVQLFHHFTRECRAATAHVSEAVNAFADGRSERLLPAVSVCLHASALSIVVCHAGGESRH